LKFLFDFIDLQQGERDKKEVLENVTSGISFRGSNLWILACAIVVASVGLNVNSTAVIIGAMLISPLMGPIVGAGFALGTYDFPLLKKSFKNLGIATFVSLFISALYFFVSPFKETQSELLARTSPNIYDVLIAFFGGLVGVIAITRVEKGNPIPGVAIATALMPPLCTAGYGLAIGNYQYFFGAFYLYVINCFFICIATFFIVKFLKYPAVSMVNDKHEKAIRYGITAFIIVLIVPSSYLAYNLLNQKKYSQKVEHFISNEFSDRGFVIIYKKLSFNSNPRKIEVAFLDKKLQNNEIEELNSKLLEYGIENTKLIVKQETSDLKAEILNEINSQTKNVSEKDITIKKLKQELSKYKFDNGLLLKEVQILFPEIDEISIGNHLAKETKGKEIFQTVVVYKTSKKNEKIGEDRLKDWLKLKLSLKEIEIIRRN